MRLSHDDLLAVAEGLVPLLRDRARDAEVARRPLDEVVAAVEASGLLPLMVPECFGGHEADLDTFFEVSLTLSQADTSMGWLISFYIEHCFWFCGFPESFQKAVFASNNYVLAPATLNAGAGTAEKTDSGYQLSGTWQWGTGVIHAEWVLLGAMHDRQPMFFALPVDDVEAVDNWHTAGMCGTGSWDIVVDGAEIPDERAVSMLDLINASGEAPRLHSGDLYRTPILPVLAFAAGLPMLGAAKSAVTEYGRQVAELLDASGGELRAEKSAVAAHAALEIEAAELVMRKVLAEVMAERNDASFETRHGWMARIAHAVFMCRDAVQRLATVTGASGGFLDNPIQRALRDITTASNHVIFDREVRYAEYGRMLVGRPVKSFMA